MHPKPTHLGAEFAAQFQDASIVRAYPHRPPYPAAVFAFLVGLLPQASRAVLDLGCGTGDLARPLAPLVARVDAVDISAGMLEAARALPGGDQPNLTWIAGSAEAAPVRPPYGLITAGESLHWMAWDVVLPRCHALLVPGGALAIVEREEAPQPWFAELVLLIQRYSTNTAFRPYHLIYELTTRALFTPLGEWLTEFLPHRQTIASFIESLHSRNGFSRDRMPPSAAAAFDDGVRALLAAAFPDGHVTLHVRARITWGTPSPSVPGTRSTPATTPPLPPKKG
ncbi:MAG: methyltransferase domain-containing protein [Ktedonobacterales bacterium]|nr:methyltransferase domain-containing protein [Ktedonobacterales bacterium]